MLLRYYADIIPYLKTIEFIDTSLNEDNLNELRTLISIYQYISEGKEERALIFIELARVISDMDIGLDDMYFINDKEI